jgi:hypothetical protein
MLLDSPWTWIWILVVPHFDVHHARPKRYCRKLTLHWTLMKLTRRPATPVFTPKPYKAVTLKQSEVPVYNNFEQLWAAAYYPRPPLTPPPFAPSIDSIVLTRILGGRVLGPVLQTMMTFDSSGQMVPVTGIPVRQENYYPPPPQMAPSSFPVRSDMDLRHLSSSCTTTRAAKDNFQNYLHSIVFA